MRYVQQNSCKNSGQRLSMQLLEGNSLEHGLFVAFSTETKDRIKLQACRFRDLKVRVHINL